MKGKKRVAIFISGRGSNMTALIRAASRPEFPAVIALVLSNVPNAQGLVSAQTAGIQTCVIDHRSCQTRAEFEQNLDTCLQGHKIDLVCLAGFMRILGSPFVNKWSGRLINIHPSLLPYFKGLNTHARALAAGVPTSGCTVHFVVPDLDAGPIILQSDPVPIRPDETPDSLATRILEQEHLIYPQALADIASGQVYLQNGQMIRNPVSTRCSTLYI